MPSNKRRHANTVPLSSFAIWIVIGLFACIGGLGYVWCKNQLHTTGAKIKALEREYADLRNKNEVSRAHIAQLSSTKALQDRFDTGFIKLTKITDDRLIAIRNQPAGSTVNELRAISNERPRK